MSAFRNASISDTLTIGTSSLRVTMRSEFTFVTEQNLSRAWATAFCRASYRGIAALSPLIVTITDFDDNQLPREDQSIRNAIDTELTKQAMRLSVETVAGTIFPHRFWQPGVGRAILFQRYKRILSRLHRDRRNQHGLYFERLIAYPNAPADGNQLAHILCCYSTGTRRKSALQASTFDPTVDMPLQSGIFNAAADHVRSARRGFPCMQQLAFAPNSNEGTLAVSAFFASQYLFTRAYGNYLGVCRLGRFMAHEMELKLDRVTCYVAYAQIESPPGKSKLSRLSEMLSEAVKA